MIASSIDYLSDAVELVLTGYTPTLLVVFDQHPQVEEQHDAVEAARARLADAGSPVSWKRCPRSWPVANDFPPRRWSFRTRTTRWHC